MTEYELSSLVFELFRDMDAQIEFWMQATFAVVVAVFFAGDRLSRGLRRGIAALYVFASILAALRWVLGLRRALTYRARMQAEGHADIPTDWWLIPPITLLIGLLFLGGVLGTVHFLRHRPVGTADAVP